MRKFLSIALSLLIVFSVIPAFAITAAAYEDSTVCVIGSTEYTKLLGENGALEAANDDDTIILVNDVSESASSTISKSVTIDLAGHKLTYSGTSTAITTSANLTIRSTVDGNGESNTEAKAAVAYSGNLINTSATATVTNISGMANACVSIFAVSSNSAKLVCQNSILDSAKGGKNYPVNFDYAATVEFENVEITGRGNWHNDSYIKMSKGVQGTFKKCKFSAPDGGNVGVYDAETNVKFIGCDLTENAWDKSSVLYISNGTVELSGETVVDGLGHQKSSLVIDNGNLTTDDAIIKGDKGSDNSFITFKINGGNIILGETQILKGGSGSGYTVNDNEAFANAIKSEYAAYNSTDYTAKTILSKSSNFKSQSKIYIDVCKHYKSSATCEAAGNCDYCGKEISALGHDMSIIKFNETQHWYVCSRCDKADEPEDHIGGTATCQKKAECEVCGQPYGDKAEHSFKNYTSSEPCEHNTVKVAECDYGCGTSDYDLSEATNTKVGKQKVEPTCEEKGSTEELICSECESVVVPSAEIPALGHTYGDETIIENPTYFTVGKAKKVCSKCGKVYEYDLPKLSFSKNTVAVIADLDNSETEIVEYKSLLGKDGAIANAKDGEKIIVVNEIEEDQSVSITDKKLTLDLAGNTVTYSGSDAAITTNTDFTITSTVDGKGKEKSDNGLINHSGTFVKTSGVATVTYISSVATSNNSIVLPSASSTKVVAKDCDLSAKSGVKASPINFGSMACEFDFENVNITARGNWNNDAYLSLNNGVHGTFTNCNLSAADGGNITISGNDTDVSFVGCNISEGGSDKWYVVCITGGTVKFSGGTVIDGKNNQNTVLQISGGNVTTDDAIIKGDKADGSNKVTLKLLGGNVEFGKTQILKGNKGAGLTVNSNENLANAIKSGYTAYSSSEYTDETVLSKNSNYQGNKTIYIDVCQHFKSSATCLNDGVCDYCGETVPALGHDMSIIQFNETQHWNVCSRGDKTDEPEDHKGGWATCQKPAECEVCGQPYGDKVEHSFTNYRILTSCEHNTAKFATCDYGCYTSDYDLSEATKTTVRKPRVEPTCTEKGSTEELICSECGELIMHSSEIPAKGHNYGDETVIEAPTYFTTGRAQKVCSVCDDVYEYVLPRVAFEKDTVAIIAKSNTDITQYKNLFGADGAIANAKDNDTIILVDNLTEDKSVSITDKKITLDLAGYSITYKGNEAAVTTNSDFAIRSTVDGKDKENTESAVITYNNTIVKTSAKITMTNIAGVANANSCNSIIAASADSATFVVSNCVLDCAYDVKSAPISFEGYATKVDFNNVIIIGRGDWNQETYLTFNNGVHGTFTNCQFKAGVPRAQGDERKDSGKVEIIGNTTNLEFIGCEFTERGSDKGSVITVTSGTVKFSGGTIINGNNSQNSVLVINGGNVTTDDAIIKGDKGDNENKMPLTIKGGIVKLGKTAIISGGDKGILCNSNDALKAALADGYTFFKSSDINGENAYVYNDNVDYTKQKAIYIDKCNHWSTTATCTADGKCYYCNAEVKAYGHDYSAYDYDETNHWKVCDRCFEVDPDSVPEAHTGGTATCTQPKECEVCGALYGDAKGHTWNDGEVVKASTCRTEGTKEFTCVDCGKTKTESIPVDVNNHSWNNGRVVKANTCKTEGTKEYVCRECGEIKTETIAIDPDAHVWNDGEVFKASTCIAEGSKKYTCTECGATKNEAIAIDPDAHTWNNGEVVKASTCIVEGSKKYTCTTCGATKTEFIPIDANKHTWNSGVVITPNTCVSNGSIERTCTSCGKKTTEVLFASSSAHKYSDNFTVDKAATLFATGLKSRHCVYCNGKTNSTVVGKLKFTVKIKAGKGSFKVTSKKYAKVAGYQVKYKLGKKTFKKTFNTKKALKKTIKQLKKGTYKVQVRAFTKKGKTKVYSKWTASKKVKVK